jgi:hypothetical protein
MGARAGEAYFALEQYEKALGYYEPICEAEEATAPIAALEQYANCLTKRAEELGREHPEAIERVLALLERAERVLTGLTSLGNTGERSALLASVYKRRAQFTTRPAARLLMLKQAADAYGKAYQLSMRGGARADTYPLINRIAIEIVLGWLDRATDGKKTSSKKGSTRTADAVGESEMTGLLAQLDQLSTARAGVYTDPYNLLARAEYLLLEALSRRSLSEDERAAIAGAYGDALSRGVTSRQRMSVQAQLAFYRNSAAALPEEERDAIVEGLNAIEEAVLPGPG